jgi:hypothetical protein
VCRFKIPQKKPKGQRDPACVKKGAIRIEVNYLPITMKDWNLPIYHYDVTFKPETPENVE